MFILLLYSRFSQLTVSISIPLIQTTVVHRSPTIKTPLTWPTSHAIDKSIGQAVTSIIEMTSQTPLRVGDSKTSVVPRRAVLYSPAVGGECEMGSICFIISTALRTLSLSLLDHSCISLKISLKKDYCTCTTTAINIVQL